MFTPHKYPNASVAPWEYYPAAAGTYKAGQVIELVDGKLTEFGEAMATMPYICMADITVAADEPVPVIRTNGDTIYQSELEADYPDAKIGTFGSVAGGGLTVALGDGGTFEITRLDGTTKGSAVFGRFYY